jgi:hypothetical protein
MQSVLQAFMPAALATLLVYMTYTILSDNSVAKAKLALQDAKRVFGE